MNTNSNEDQSLVATAGRVVSGSVDKILTLAKAILPIPFGTIDAAAMGHRNLGYLVKVVMVAKMRAALMVNGKLEIYLGSESSQSKFVLFAPADAISAEAIYFEGARLELSQSDYDTLTARFGNLETLDGVESDQTCIYSNPEFSAIDADRDFDEDEDYNDAFEDEEPIVGIVDSPSSKPIKDDEEEERIV